MVPVLQVLLADADAVTRNALALLLKSKLGLTAIGEASDGATLTRLVAENCPRLVLMDWSLPGRPDRDLLLAMQRANPRLRLVILSVDAAAETEATALGAVFIHKASAAEQVLEQLRGLCEHDQPCGHDQGLETSFLNEKDSKPSG